MAHKTIYLAGGCFWGLEDFLREQPGVIDTEVGYCSDAEALAISYDTEQSTYAALLDFFFRVHDPTTLNRQGNDTGSSYRSAIFYQNQEELEIAQSMIETVNQSGLYKHPVVTSLEPYTMFYAAEDYHQDYLQKHPGGYTCHYVRSKQSLIQ